MASPPLHPLLTPRHNLLPLLTSFRCCSWAMSSPLEPPWYRYLQFTFVVRWIHLRRYYYCWVIIRYYYYCCVWPAQGPDCCDLIAQSLNATARACPDFVRRYRTPHPLRHLLQESWPRCQHRHQSVHYQSALCDDSSFHHHTSNLISGSGCHCERPPCDCPLLPCN